MDGVRKAPVYLTFWSHIIRRDRGLPVGSGAGLTPFYLLFFILIASLTYKLIAYFRLLV